MGLEAIAVYVGNKQVINIMKVYKEDWLQCIYWALI